MTIAQLIDRLELIRAQYGELEVAFLFDDITNNDETAAVTITYDVDASAFQFLDNEKIVAGLRVPYACDCPECTPPEPKKKHLKVVQ